MVVPAKRRAVEGSALLTGAVLLSVLSLPWLGPVAGVVAGVATLTIETNSAAECSSATESLITVTMSYVNTTGRVDLVWLFKYHPSDTDDRKPGSELVPFRQDELTEIHTHNWSCPSDLGQWNISVTVCPATDGFDCPDHTTWLAHNTTTVLVRVGLDSLVSLPVAVAGCTTAGSATFDIDAALLLQPGTVLPPSLVYRFRFARDTAGSSSAVAGTNGNMPHWRDHLVTSGSGADELVSNSTHVRLTKVWTCYRNGSTAGPFHVVVEIRDHSTNSLLAYNSSLVRITRYFTRLTVNMSRSLAFTCALPTPIVVSYTGLANPSLSISTNWSVVGAPRAIDPINGTVNAKPPFQTILQWRCPYVYGAYTIALQLLDSDRTVDNVLAEDKVNLTVAAELSSGHRLNQTGRGQHRSSSPLAMGTLIMFELHDVSIARLPKVTLGDFFNGTQPQISYQWQFNDHGGATSNFTTLEPYANYTYQNASVYSPRVSLLVHGASVDACDLLLGNGSVEFGSLSIVSYVSDVAVVGPESFTVTEFEQTNYTLSCFLSSDEGSILTRLCWNLTLVETNSSLMAPYQTGCDGNEAGSAAYSPFNHTLAHVFNISGIYMLDYNCSNAVSLVQKTLEIQVNDAPSPPKIPVVSYTLPLVLTMVIGLGASAVLFFLVYKRRKNRHVEVAEFDYLHDWDDPRPRTFKDRLIEKMGRVCGCLPGPWHWKKTERTQRYLSLAMRTNTADYGAMQSFSMSMS